VPKQFCISNLPKLADYLKEKLDTELKLIRCIQKIIIIKPLFDDRLKELGKSPFQASEIKDFDEQLKLAREVGLLEIYEGTEDEVKRYKMLQSFRSLPSWNWHDSQRSSVDLTQRIHPPIPRANSHQSIPDDRCRLKRNTGFKMSNLFGTHPIKLSPIIFDRIRCIRSNWFKIQLK
jgi:hypothetical protein